MRRTYWPINDLLEEPPEALIVTGTEPRSAALEEEPYWASMVELHRVGRDPYRLEHLVLSGRACGRTGPGRRAAAAPRRKSASACSRTRPLPSHPLLQAVGDAAPHAAFALERASRAGARAAGYVFRAASPETGADLFVRPGVASSSASRATRSTRDTTLLKEYRRDVGRFLRGEHADWPAVPRGYFPPQSLARPCCLQGPGRRHAGSRASRRISHGRADGADPGRLAACRGADLPELALLALPLRKSARPESTSSRYDASENEHERSQRQPHHPSHVDASGCSLSSARSSVLPPATGRCPSMRGSPSSASAPSRWWASCLRSRRNSTSRSRRIRSRRRTSTPSPAMEAMLERIASQ